MRGLSKGLLCLITAAFATAANADIIVDGQRLTIADVQEYTVTVVDGVYTIDITTENGWILEPATAVDCTANPNDPACQETPPTPPPPPPPPSTGVATTLTASTTTAELGDTVTFTWTANNAVSCDTKWGNTQWKSYVPNPAGGSVGIIMDALGETQFRMKCDDAAGNSQAVGVFITVVQPVQTPNNTTCEDPEVWNGSETTWRDYLGDWYPNVSNAEQRKIIRDTDYVAIEFNTSTADVRGLFQTIQVSDPNRFVSVNECPGRFTDSEPGCFNRQSNGQEIQWSTDGTFGSCTLEKNKDYYLNITYVNVEEIGTGTLCDTGSCAFNLKVVTQETP